MAIIRQMADNCHKGRDTDVFFAGFHPALKYSSPVGLRKAEKKVSQFQIHYINGDSDVF